MRWFIQILTVVLALAALMHGATMQTETFRMGAIDTNNHGSLVIYKTHHAWPADLASRLRTLSGPQPLSAGVACIPGQCQDV